MADSDIFHSMGKGKVWKEPGAMTQGRREVEVGTLLLDNDENNVTDDKVLSHFWCLSLKYASYVSVLNNSYWFSVSHCRFIFVPNIDLF